MFGGLYYPDFRLFGDCNLESLDISNLKGSCGAIAKCTPICLKDELSKTQLKRQNWAAQLNLSVFFPEIFTRDLQHTRQDIRISLFLFFKIYFLSIYGQMKYPHESKVGLNLTKSPLPPKNKKRQNTTLFECVVKISGQNSIYWAEQPDFFFIVSFAVYTVILYACYTVLYCDEDNYTDTRIEIQAGG